MGRHHGGPERRESAEQTAERLLKEELTRRRCGPEDLRELAKGHKQKVRM
jgi:hypothetical protein